MAERHSLEHSVALSRRALCTGIGAAAVLGGLGALRYVAQDQLLRPPGGQDEDHLASTCIRCSLCYEACPRKLIYPAHLESGIFNLRSPQMDYATDFCDFCAEANDGVPLCVSACPTGALQLDEGTAREDVVIGNAQIDTYTCLAYRETGCRACYDACAAYGNEAITLNTTYSNYPLPEVDAEKCIGCGACEAHCLSLTAGSIVTGATQTAIKVYPLEQQA